MWTVVGLIVAYLFLAALANNPGRPKPTEFDKNVCVPGDPEQTERNLKDAIQAWKVGNGYMSEYARQKQLEQFTAAQGYRGTITLADPNAAEPERRLVRCCPMHKPRWE